MPSRDGNCCCCYTTSLAWNNAWIGRFLGSGGTKNKREWLPSNLTSEYVLRPPALVQGTDSRGVYWLFLLFDQCGMPLQPSSASNKMFSLRWLDLVCMLTE